MKKMSCEAVRDALLAGRAPTEPELLEHAATCPSCESLLADHGSLGAELAAPATAIPADPPRWAEMATLVEHEVGWRAWLRSRSTPWRRGAGVVGFALVTLLGLRHLRADIAVMPVLELAGLLAAFALTASVALRRALTVSGGARPSLDRWLLAAALGVPVVLSFVRTSALTPAAADGTAFVHQACGCFLYGSLITAPLAVLIWAMDRGGGSRSQPLLAAAVAGLAANAALTLHCPHGGAGHLLLGHAAIGVGLAAMAWLFQRRTEGAPRS
jgi:hypothetical protein